MINRNIILTFIFLVFLSSCEKRDWDNPFDPDCPKEIFTPGYIVASQQDKTIKVTWTQNYKHISGFRLYRNSNNGPWEIKATLDKNTETWVDNYIEGGINYGYKIVAVAGDNISYERQTLIKPILGASLTTNKVVVETSSSAKSGGNITYDGGGPITARGVCWSISNNPTITDSKTAEGTGTGMFTSDVTGLQSNTTYYIRAYATNSFGTVYGNEIRFPFYLNFPGPTATDRDGNTYKSVMIGDQI